MKIKDKNFVPYLNEDEIQKRIKRLASDINKDYKETKPLFIAILNGSFMFASDLFKEVKLDCEISFMKLSSYNEMKSTGNVRELIGLNENVFNRDVIIIEDIVDTGHTMKNVLEQFKDRGVKSVEVVSLLIKPEALVNDVVVKYIGFEIPNKFVVGYGLDYDGFGRNTKTIYQLKS
ncbi:Hypoxanthine-guanine phosphoribosyltransferase [hydrothermal vent metagenome]|uniref:hypoxanthine phosphoribosyltransferase n=1 Tax=hydrothermal vent metagenome TaxID=652676 RepID=A0A3B0UKD2_9ZZZZ